MCDVGFSIINLELSVNGQHPYSLDCSKFFTNENGTITSPCFLCRTHNDANCTYAIRLQKGARIQLVCHRISLSDRYAANYLKMFDGPASIHT